MTLLICAYKTLFTHLYLQHTYLYYNILFFFNDFTINVLLIICLVSLNKYIQNNSIYIILYFFYLTVNLKYLSTFKYLILPNSLTIGFINIHPLLLYSSYIYLLIFLYRNCIFYYSPGEYELQLILTR